jgi:hypothetical protein
MPYIATVLKVMIASPGDVATERGVAEEVIHGWNAVHSQDRRTVLLPVAWETHAVPALGERAQAIINRQLVRDSDLLVAIFWTRIGTPTGAAASGTIEEIEEHLRAGKRVMLYFSAAPVRLDSVDDAQYHALREFKESYRQRGLVEEYESVSQFREKFARQLAQTIIQRFPITTVGHEGELVQGPVAPGRAAVVTLPEKARSRRRLSADERDLIASVSAEARELLIEAGRDQHATVLRTESMGGLSVETNRRDFVNRGDARSEARGRRIVRELVERGFLEQRDTRNAPVAISGTETEC